MVMVATGLLLTGCARPPEEDANRIRFAIWGSVRQEAAERRMIEEFQRLHPEIRVDLITIGSRYPEKMQAMMVGNVAPDVFLILLYDYYDWAARGVLKDLTDDFEAMREEGEILPVAEKLVQFRGRVHGLPVNAHGFVLYCNLDALESAGVSIPEEGFSWEHLREIAPRLSARHGDPDAPTDYLLQLPQPVIFFWQHGVQLFDDLTHPTRVTVNTPAAVEALDFYRGLQGSGHAVPPEVVQDEGSFQLFRDGRTAFFISGRWSAPEFIDRTAFRWDIHRYPRGPVSDVTWHGGSTIGIWSKTPRVEAARAFARFYTSREGSALNMQFGRTVPVHRDLAYGEEFLGIGRPPGMRRFSETMEDGAANFFLYAPGAREVTRIFNQRMEQAVATPELSSEELLVRLEEDLNRWLDRMKQRGLF